MKSFCIKTNNQEIINYLLKSLEASSLEDIYYINKQFKCYQNVVIHYLGREKDLFFSIIATTLTDVILIYYEPSLINKIIDYHYFYFDEFEKKIIEQNCYEYINFEEAKNTLYRREAIYSSIVKYISENKSMILDGFVTFRLQKYIDFLEDAISYSVNQYVIEKEYNEFINLLKLYIDSKESQTSFIHLIYTNGESILLDSKKHLINTYDSILNANYLSDISFSSNDYTLNTLLTLLPSKIEIHLTSGLEDEFIKTLKLIFENRISICTKCNLCNTYKILNNVNLKK